jgi:hypothetical protein
VDSGKRAFGEGLQKPRNYAHPTYSTLPPNLNDEDGADSTARLLPDSGAVWGGIELGRGGAASSLIPPNRGHSAPHPAPAIPEGAVLVIRDLDLRADAIDPASAVLPRLLVARLSLAVTAGMRLLVTGPSGCGKSTLVRRISAVLRGTSTVGTFNDFALRDVNGEISLHVPLEAFVICPQAPYLAKVCFMCFGNVSVFVLMICITVFTINYAMCALSCPWEVLNSCYFIATDAGHAAREPALPAQQRRH